MRVPDVDPAGAAGADDPLLAVVVEVADRQVREQRLMAGVDPLVAFGHLGGVGEHGEAGQLAAVAVERMHAAVGVAEDDRLLAGALQVGEHWLALAAGTELAREPGAQAGVMVNGDRAPLLAHAAAGVEHAQPDRHRVGLAGLQRLGL